MKLCKIIEGQQRDNPDFHFLDYRLLDCRLQRLSSGRHSGEVDLLAAKAAFEQDLAAEISVVNACFGQKRGELLQSIADLSQKLQKLGAGATASEVFPQTKAANSPDDDMLGAWAAEGFWPSACHRLLEVVGRLTRLRDFAVWNSVAVAKLLRRWRRHAGGGKDVEVDGWLARQSFFDGSGFAELCHAIKSLGQAPALLTTRPKLSAHDGKLLWLSPSTVEEFLQPVGSASFKRILAHFLCSDVLMEGATSEGIGRQACRSGTFDFA